VRSPPETTRDAGLAPSPSRPHVRLSDRQFSGENGDPSLPEQQQDIPLDTGDDASLGTSSIDTLKGMLHYSSVLIQFNLSIYNGTQRYLALAALFRLEQAFVCHISANADLWSQLMVCIGSSARRLRAERLTSRTQRPGGSRLCVSGNTCGVRVRVSPGQTANVLMG